jgi:hypothetical protein
LAYASVLSLGSWKDSYEGFETTKEIYTSLASEGSKILEKADGDNQHNMDYNEAIITELNYADPEIRGQIDVPIAFEDYSEDESLEKLVDQMEELYEEQESQ